MDNYKFVKVEVIDEQIAVLQITRPEVMNAMNIQVISELADAVVSLEENNAIQCVIITGETDNFISGADIREINGMSVKEAYNFAQKMKALYVLVVQSKKPYIAAISGYCLGSGMELALACDIRLGNTNAMLGFPETNLGIIPGGGGIHRLKDIAGISGASQIVMTGELLDVHEAKELQIINEVSEDVFSRAKSIARKIASKSQFSISTIKKLLNSRDLRQSSFLLEEEIHEFSKLFDHADAYEGMSAFIEKREPVFVKREVKQS